VDFSDSLNINLLSKKGIDDGEINDK